MLGLTLTVLLVLTSSHSWAQQLKERIYSDIGDVRPCFRRMNSTHQIGCSSKTGGNVGVLIYLESVEEFEKLEDNEFAPYILLVDPYIFSSTLLETLQSSGLVAGVLLPSVDGGRWDGHYPSQGYSDDNSCPSPGLADNRADCDTKNPWNPSGQATMWTDWDFPIFYLENNTLAEQIYSCYAEHNTMTSLSWPLCSMELTSDMFGSTDSATCLRRSSLFSISPVRLCDPLSDDNIHHFLSPRLQAEDQDSVIVVAAKMDALTLFDQLEAGFDSPASGIVTLLSVAHAVSRAVNNNPQYRNGIKNVLFLLIHGESFDYIGSTRLVHDMKNDAFPFNNSDETVREKTKNGSQPNFSLDNIDSVIEVDQISNINNNNQVYLHTSNNPNKIVNALRESSDQLRLAEVPNSLPPSSSVSFLAGRARLPTVVLSNYNVEFSNKMYHSVYDTAARAGYSHSKGARQPVVQHLARVSHMLASAVLQLATDNSPLSTNILDQAELINDLLHCYGVTSNCSKFYEASEPDNFPWVVTPDKRGSTPFPQYVGVRSSFHTLMTKLMLQYLTGDVQNVGDQTPGQPQDEVNAEEIKKCRDMNKDQNIYSYVYLVGGDCHNTTNTWCGHCYRTTVHTTQAVSPIMEDFDSWSQEDGDLKYPTWTESIWKTINARMFLQGSPAHDQGIFVLGILVFAISVFSMFWIDKKSNVIFQHPKVVEVDNPVPVEM